MYICKTLTFFIMLRLFFFIIVLFSSCTNKNISTSFYHWKQKLNFTTQEKQYINNTKCKKIYTKFFDIVTKSNTIKPIAKLNIVNYTIENELVPCIYITNNVFKITSKNKKLKQLAHNIFNLINQIYPFKKKYNEIQIDCDWSLKTKHNYFKFLRFFKK